MNVVIIILLLVAVLLLAKIAFKKPAELSPDTKARFEAGLREERVLPSLNELVEQMREKESRERDEALAVYAEKKRKKMPFINPVLGPSSEDRIHTTNPKAEKILIPENLSEEEKQTLRDFFNL